MATAAGYLIRHLATGRDLQPAAANVMNLWRDFIEGKCEGTLDGIDGALADQTTFAKLARQLIDDMGYGDQLGDDTDQEDEDQDEEGQSDEDEQPDSTGEDDQYEQDDEASPEQSQEQQSDTAQASVTMDDMAEAELSLIHI